MEPRFRHCEEQSDEAVQPPSNDPKKFDRSGKSPAYLHHRKNFRARAGKPAAGFFNRTAAAFATHYLLSVARRVCKRAAVRASTARYHPLANASRLPWGKPLRTFPDRALLAGARERAGRGVDLVHVARGIAGRSAMRIALGGRGFVPEMIASAIMPHFLFVIAS
jgi:hypothetical protein